MQKPHCMTKVLHEPPCCITEGIHDTDSYTIKGKIWGTVTFYCISIQHGEFTSQPQTKLQNYVIQKNY